MEVYWAITRYLLLDTEWPIYLHVLTDKNVCDQHYLPANKIDVCNSCVANSQTQIFMFLKKNKMLYLKPRNMYMHTYYVAMQLYM